MIVTMQKPNTWKSLGSAVRDLVAKLTITDGEIRERGVVAAPVEEKAALEARQGGLVRGGETSLGEWNEFRRAA